MLADVIGYWEMMSYMVLDSISWFLCLKDVTNTGKRMRPSLSTCNGGKLEEAEGFKCVLVVYCMLESKYIRSSA